MFTKDPDMSEEVAGNLDLGYPFQEQLSADSVEIPTTILHNVMLPSTI